MPVLGHEGVVVEGNRELGDNNEYTDIVRG